MKHRLAAAFLIPVAILGSGSAWAALNCKKFDVVKPDRATLYLTDCGTVLKNFKPPVSIDPIKKTIRYGTSYSNSLAGVCYQGTHLAKLNGKAVTVLTSGAWVGAIDRRSNNPYQEVLTQHTISDKGYSGDRLYAVDRIYFTKLQEIERMLGGTGHLAGIDPGSSTLTFNYTASAAKSGILPLSITVTRTKGDLCFME